MTWRVGDHAMWRGPVPWESSFDSRRRARWGPLLIEVVVEKVDAGQPLVVSPIDRPEYTFDPSFEVAHLRKLYPPVEENHDPGDEHR